MALGELQMNCNLDVLNNFGVRLNTVSAFGGRNRFAPNSRHSSYHGLHPNETYYYITDGEMHLEYNGKCLVCQAGTIIYIPNDYIYELYWVDTPDGISGWCSVTFELYDMQNKVVTLGPEPEILLVDRHFKLLPIFQQLHNVYVNDGIACHFKCYELFWQLSYQLKMLTTKNNLKSEYNKIYKGILYLEQHFTQDVGPDELAEMCGLSVCYFRRLFRQYKDMSPVKYRNLLRMKKARELLESGDYTVAEASDAVGCTDVFYFSKQFKSVFGINASDCKPRPHIEKQQLQNE